MSNIRSLNDYDRHNENRPLLGMGEDVRAAGSGRVVSVFASINMLTIEIRKR